MRKLGEKEMRARYPDNEGFVERNGLKIFYEVFGTGSPTIFFLPTWSLVHSRVWKAQISYFARHCRVLTCDGLGNGRSDRPTNVDAYSDVNFTADFLAVMDATNTEQAVLVSISSGSNCALLLASKYPDRVLASVFIAPAQDWRRYMIQFDKPLDSTDSIEGWAKFNRFYWKKNYRDFVEFFISKAIPEPHSTKQIEDGVSWGLETTPEILTLTVETTELDKHRIQELSDKVHCPVLVLHGDQDAIVPQNRGKALALATSGTFVSLEGSGHSPQTRDPVKINHLIRDFALPAKFPKTWRRSKKRNKRALYISSPIGLGHIQRDLAIADELRKLHPDLEIVWLAQHPVSEFLKYRGEKIHPASFQLAIESEHIERESKDHDLHIFQVFREMNEISYANFSVFLDIVREEDFDLWIGDEAWEIDYFLHENPEEKRAAYVWLTDFVGWLPMPDGGKQEEILTADYNAEMIEQIARFPRVRDRAIFIGNPDDIIPKRFGPDLPWIREWTEQHYSFSGYITSYDPKDFPDREAIRAELGYRPNEKVCIVTVGGSSVGVHLLHQIIASFNKAKILVPELRMIIVTGPRIKDLEMETTKGLEIHGYIHNLYRYLAGCDLGIVQGGLTTTMELITHKIPFLYFPLCHHFEQNFHVKYRLNRYAGGRMMDFKTATTDDIADAIAAEIGRKVEYRDVETDGAAKAAALIAELL
jgi:pimeloyl-ACP methyl ester carboxylesterase/predicted glycosyltransferase